MKLKGKLVVVARKEPVIVNIGSNKYDWSKCCRVTTMDDFEVLKKLGLLGYGLIIPHV